MPLRLTLALVLVPAVFLTAICASLARSAEGLPFPSFFVDPYAHYSAAELTSWGLDPAARPQRVLGAAGTPLGDDMGFGDMPAHKLRRALDTALAAGQTEIELSTLVNDTPKVARYPIRKMGLPEIGFFFGVYAIAAWLVLWSGLMVVVVAGRRAGARAYLFWSVVTCVFLLTFFDYHSTMRLTFLFGASTAAVPAGFVALAYAFPEPPRVYARALGRAFSGLLALSGAAALVLALAPLVSHDARWLQHRVPFFAAAAIALLSAAVAVRYRQSEGRERQELLSTLWGLSWVPIAVIGLLLGGAVGGSGLFHLAAPFVVLAIPLAIGFALVRHNILASTLVLSRVMVSVPVALLCALVAATVALLSAALVRRGGVEQVFPVLVAAAVFLGLHRVVRRAAQSTLFPATAQFRPTIEQLGDAITTLRGHDNVARAVCDVIARWLPVSEARVLDIPSVAEIPHLPPDALAQLGVGEWVWTLETPWQRKLLLPMRSLGQLRAVLWLAPKHQGALYTSEDIALLHTIAGMGAAALHTVAAVAELEALRHFEVAATRQEKALTVELLVAEISHEIAYPLSFFRFLLKRADKGEPLLVNDIEIGREEVERLGRMLSHLRKLQAAPSVPGPVPVAELARRAMALLRELATEQQTEVLLDVPDDLVVLAEVDALLQVFSNLLKNAIQAAGRKGMVGVCFRPDDEGGILEVFDSGPGVSASIETTLFDPWVTAKVGGAGLGLAITDRIVRSFGWSISFARADERTRFLIRVPRSSIVTGDFRGRTAEAHHERFDRR